ncbi:hypothetical protein [Oscillatoria sp. FACHB-1406]|uniref:hypothetical protein n=1 Tax=Oscillatoria sp. FACHB-1406 TaxID=2692846 RepID=UPI001689C37E|nr:hypothetical protein [Oscillatoria sp. FACHB-1406]MBD2578670.1 hypothetical protein [Oscillatoria sp. FACHB-1406]
MGKGHAFLKNVLYHFNIHPETKSIKMLRSLLASVLAFTIAFLGFSQAAKAAPNPSLLFPSSVPLVASTPNINFFDATNPKTYWEFATFLGDEYKSNPLVKSTIDSAAQTAGGMIGGFVVCYAVSGVATTFFPPVAVLTPYCPGFGAASTSGSFGMEKVWQAIKAM